MMRARIWLSLGAVLALAAGCGKPTLPGRQFQGERQEIPGLIGADTPLPEQPVHQWGPEDANVRVLAFYPIDEPHQPLFDRLKEYATERYPGKLYVRYADYRTPQGGALFSRAQATVPCIMINGSFEVDLKTPTGFRTVDFVRDMGRFWTLDDLDEAIEKVVAEASGAEVLRR